MLFLFCHNNATLHYQLILLGAEGFTDRRAAGRV